MPAALGGPLKRNLLFYFGGIERLHTASGNVVNTTFAAANGAFPADSVQTLWLAKLDATAGTGHTVRLRYNGEHERNRGRSIGGTGTEEHGRFTDYAPRMSWAVGRGPRRLRR